MRAGTIRGETAEKITRLLGVPGAPRGWRHRVTMDYEDGHLGINVSTRDAFARLTVFYKDPEICLSIVDRANATHTFKSFRSGRPISIYEQEWNARTGDVGPKHHFNLAHPEHEALVLARAADAVMNLATPHMNRKAHAPSRRL